MRHQYLIKASPLHAAQNGIWAYANITGAVTATAPSTTAAASSSSPVVNDGGLRAASAVLHCQANLENDGASAEGASIAVDVLDAEGKVVASTHSAVVEVPPAYSVSSVSSAADSTAAAGTASGAAQLNVRATIADAELWSVKRPYLYTLTVRVLSSTVRKRICLALFIVLYAKNRMKFLPRQAQDKHWKKSLKTCFCRRVSSWTPSTSLRVFAQSISMRTRVCC
jgi:hypothetical protein